MQKAGASDVRIHVRENLLNFMLLAMLAIFLFNTNRMFTFIDDEANMLGPDAQPTGVFLRSLGAITRGNEHPPLYDLLLHSWLRLTGGAMDWLRVPSVLFFVAGIFCLSRAAKRLGGSDAAAALLWLGLLWPYGFHFGRLAGWYSLVFLLIAALTWAHLQHVELLSKDPPDPKRCRSAWIRVCVLGLALVYANYLGWALLFLLALDDWIRNRARPGTLKRLLVTAGIFVVAYTPLWPFFWYEIRSGTTLHQSWTYRLLNTAYNVYVLFVSESVGPWFWKFGVPAAIAVAACLLLTFFGLRGPARRFLIFEAILIVAMALIGILYPRRLFIVAPWILLGVAVAIGTVQNTSWRIAIALSLGLIATLGWYGVYTKRYYATPRFFEPWPSVAQDADSAARAGAMVIGNNPSFFFYLTYALQVPPSASGWRFSGLLPETVHYPQVWEPDEWAEAGHPLRQIVLWVRGMPGPDKGTPMAAAADWLDMHCAAGTVQYMARDPSYTFKQRFAPQIDQLLWRIEIRKYSCDLPNPEAPAGKTTAP
jgi:hypothetical protein